MIEGDRYFVVVDGLFRCLVVRDIDSSCFNSCLRFCSQGDGTYDTVSTLQFFASRFENDVTFSCEATNPVKELKNEGSLRKEDRLEVFCK